MSKQVKVRKRSLPLSLHHKWFKLRGKPVLFKLHGVTNSKILLENERKRMKLKERYYVRVVTKKRSPKYRMYVKKM